MSTTDGLHIIYPVQVAICNGQLSQHNANDPLKKYGIYPGVETPLTPDVLDAGDVVGGLGVVGLRRVRRVRRVVWVFFSL